MKVELMLFAVCVGVVQKREGGGEGTGRGGGVCSMHRCMRGSTHHPVIAAYDGSLEKVTGSLPSMLVAPPKSSMVQVCRSSGMSLWEARPGDGYVVWTNAEASNTS